MTVLVPLAFTVCWTPAALPGLPELHKGRNMAIKNPGDGNTQHRQLPSRLSHLPVVAVEVQTVAVVA